MREKIKGLGAYGILLTFFGIGYAIGTGFWSSSVSDLNSRIAGLRNELDIKTNELNQVKSDYLAYLNRKGNYDTNNFPVEPENEKGDTLKSSSFIEVKTIRVENSESFFKNQITISLVALNFTGSPLRHKVIGNISSPSGKVVEIDNLDIGNVITYIGDSKFKVTILQADTFFASFQVVKE